MGIIVFAVKIWYGERRVLNHMPGHEGYPGNA
jgi:hypothetical protein